MTANLVCRHPEKIVPAENLRGDRHNVISQRFEVVASFGITFQDFNAGVMLIAVVFNYEFFVRPAEIGVVALLGNGTTL